MPLIAVPNVSTSDVARVEEFMGVVDASGCRVLDRHLDGEHGRTVLTCTGGTDELIAAMTALAVEASRSIDLDEHRGAHPYVGALDVCPFVPHDIAMDEATRTAKETGAAIGAAGIPVFFYGYASNPARSLPEIRAGGLAGLSARVADGLRPDAGPLTIDPDIGVVCVGAREVLIAFNVWIDGGVEVARNIAARVRTAQSGLPGVRALGLAVIAHGGSQVSMNLTAPDRAGIEEVFGVIEGLAAESGSRPVATEIVGLVPERFLPDPDATVTRLLIEPGHCLEALLN